MEVKLFSSIKIITSGLMPTTENLEVGQIALGKLLSDNKYHLCVNLGEGIESFVLSDSATQDLNKILTEGNQTNLSIIFNDSTGKANLIISSNGITVGSSTVINKNGYLLDHGQPVLSANKTTLYTELELQAMRDNLSVYSKSEVDGLVVGIFHIKGSVDSFSDLPTDSKAGDVYNIRNAGGVDMNNIPIKAGDNVVYVNDGEKQGWDVLSGTVDLSDYYTKEQIDNLKVGTKSDVGINNDLFNDIASHTIENTESKNNHLEGSTNTLKKTDKTYNNDSNHIEGENNIAGGYAGHVENSYNQVHETNAHAGGKHSVASGSGSFSQGRGVIAFGTATFATGQSAKGGDSNVTTLIDAEIDWATQTNEDEVGRAQRIAAKLIDLWHNDANFKQQFTAALGSGAIAGGVNTFVNGGSSFGHGYECEVTAQFGVATGYLTKVLANGGFAHGYDTWSSGEYSTTFGLSNRNVAKNGFVIGANCVSNANGENGFVGGQSSEVQAKNGFAFGLGCFAAAPQAFALGQNIVVGTQNQTAVGQFNNNNSKAFFAVGVGANGDNRKNAFEVFNTYAVSWGDLLFSKSLRSASAGNSANNTIVFGTNVSNTASADNSFTGGENSQSQAKNAFTFGLGCYAAATGSTAFGQNTVVGTPYQFAVGKFNDNDSKALFAVGAGTASARKNVFEVFDDRIAINSDKMSLSTTNDITTLKLGDFAKLQIKPSMASSGQYACSLIMNPIYGYTEPTTIEMDALSSAKICVGYTNNAVMFNYSNGSQPEFYVKDVTNSRIKLFSSDFDTEGKDELVRLSTALNNKSLFAAVTDLINNSGSGLSNVVTKEADGSIKLGQYATLKLDSASTDLYTLEIENTLGPPSDKAILQLGYTGSISIPMGYDGNNTSVNFKTSVFSNPCFQIKDTTDTLYLYNNSDLNNLLLSVKNKSYGSVFGAINALISGNTKIIEIPTANTITLDDNKESRITNRSVTALTIKTPTSISDNYSSSFSFTSGATATTITIRNDLDGVVLVFNGDDCNSGVFTPAANKMYYVNVKNIGQINTGKTILVADVKSIPSSLIYTE